MQSHHIAMEQVEQDVRLPPLVVDQPALPLHPIPQLGPRQGLEQVDGQDGGATNHDLGALVGTTCAAGNRPSICNIPAACTGFTDLTGVRSRPTSPTI